MTTSLFVLAVPLLTHAQISISEVMYDPPGSDDKQEWIELFNGGDQAVDLTKWTFSDGSSATKHGFNVPPKNGGIGSLMLSPGSYLIVADDAPTFISAFPSVANVIDSTMSLPDPNVGLSATVTLYDEQKNVADTFVYVAGSNADNKGDSVQRSSSGIIPAASTPGASNATAADTSIIESAAASASTSIAAQNQQAAVSSYVPPPVPVLFADAGADRIEIVGADTEFRGRAYTRTQDTVDRVRYVWNFGDGSTAEGETVLHHFSYPGRYAVTLTVAQDKNTAIDRITVTAEPARLAFVVYADGSVEIVNKANRELDLSLWWIKSGIRQFMLPEGSIVLPSASIRVPQPTLGFWSNGDTELQYPNGVTALLAGQATAPATDIAPTVPTPPVDAQQNDTEKHTNQRAVSASPRQDPDHQEASVESSSVQDRGEANATSSQVAAAASAVPVGSPWLWGALGIAGLGAVAGVVARKQKRQEWEIEEASDTV